MSGDMATCVAQCVEESLLLTRKMRRDINQAMISTSAIGERVRKARRKLKLSQSRLAQKATLQLKQGRVHQGYISRLERGFYDDPGARVVLAIEKALGLAAGSLVAGGGRRPRASS